MKKVYISKNYRDRFTASSKAKIDAETIIKQVGYINIGLSQKHIVNKTIGRLWSVISNLKAFLCMPYNGVVFLQYPVNFVKQQIQMAKTRGNKIVVLLHDISSIRNGDELKEINELKYADIIIVHTDAMKSYLKNNGFECDLSVINIFDYLGTSHIVSTPPKPYSVAFAGNLGKSTFLNKTTFRNIRLNLFGVGIDKLTLKEGVVYCGCFSPDKLSRYINSHFGLVWDGNSIDTCSGSLGEYLRLISPHKISMYLSAGLPVIVWKESAMASFVKRNKVGILIDSLSDLDFILPQLPDNEYEILKHNATIISKKVGSGYFLKCVLSQIE